MEAGIGFTPSITHLEDLQCLFRDTIENDEGCIRNNKLSDIHKVNGTAKKGVLFEK